MDYGTASDLAVRVAWWGGGASLVASLLMLLAVLLLRVSQSARLRHERAFTERWQQVLAECVAGEKRAPPPLDEKDGYLFLRLWNSMHESVRGEAKESLNTLARRLRADRLAITYLGSRDTYKELIAILTLGNLREPLAADLMGALVEHRLPVVSLRAAQALLRIEGERALPLVLARGAEREDWPLPRLINALRELDAEPVSTRLASAIDAALRSPGSEARGARLLRLHEAARPELLRPAIQRALATAREFETLTAALAALRHPEDIGHARRLLAHDDWRVRLQAVYAVRRLGSKTDVPALAPLLGDAAWWVRYRVAQAIVALAAGDESEIRQLAGALSDPFAADALRQALAERAAA